MHKHISPHGDFDHMCDSLYLIDKFKVENVIFNCGEFNALEKELIKKLNKRKVNYCSCIKELNIGKYKLDFLSILQEMRKKKVSRWINVQDSGKPDETT